VGAAVGPVALQPRRRRALDRPAPGLRPGAALRPRDRRGHRRRLRPDAGRAGRPLGLRTPPLSPARRRRTTRSPRPARPPAGAASTLDGDSLFQPGGLRLDLNGIAKGFAVDQVAAALDRAGARSYLVEVGGELRGTGAKPDGQPWWVELERPPTANDGLRTLVALHGLSVATSGDYRRFFEHDGRRYAHTLDPATAAPVAHATVSVTVLDPAACAPTPTPRP
jgi:hypothetical protein